MLLALYLGDDSSAPFLEGLNKIIHAPKTLVLEFVTN